MRFVVAGFQVPLVDGYRRSGLANVNKNVYDDDDDDDDEDDPVWAEAPVSKIINSI